MSLWVRTEASYLVTKRGENSYVRRSGNCNPLSCYGNFRVQTRSTMFEACAKDFTRTALAHHFEFLDDATRIWSGDDTNKLSHMKPWQCLACCKHPIQECYQYAPWTIYRDIFDLIIATLTLTSKKATRDHRLVIIKATHLQYLGQKRVHQWLRRKWMRLKPKARLQRVTQSTYNLT